MKTPYIPALFALGVSLALSATAVAESAAPKSDSTLPMLGEQTLVSASATVLAVNMETRELTLKGELGSEFTTLVDPRVKRLNEVKVGDKVNVRYYVSLAAEFREPTVEEKALPLQIVDDTETAVKGPPGAGRMRILKGLVTIEGLDRPTNTVTIKGPRGNYATVKVKDPVTLEHMKLGQTLIAVYTEAFAVALQKAAPIEAEKAAE